MSDAVTHEDDHQGIKRYSVGEEMANVAIHGAGVGLSIAALVILVMDAVRQGSVHHVVGVSIFGGTLVLLYLMSTIYHSMTHPKAKPVFRMLDHIAIYLLIAGSYTPFTLVTLRGGWGWSLLVATWTLALIGVFFTLFHRKKRYSIVAVIFYIGLGWIVLFAIKPIVENLPVGGIIWLVLGGFFYTFGVIFYLWRRLPFHHAIWHLFVLLGSLSHFFAVFLYVTPEAGLS